MLGQIFALCQLFVLKLEQRCLTVKARRRRMKLGRIIDADADKAIMWARLYDENHQAAGGQGVKS